MSDHNNTPEGEANPAADPAAPPEASAQEQPAGEPGQAGQAREAAADVADEAGVADAGADHGAASKGDASENPAAPDAEPVAAAQSAVTSPREPTGPAEATPETEDAPVAEARPTTPVAADTPPESPAEAAPATVEPAAEEVAEASPESPAEAGKAEDFGAMLDESNVAEHSQDAKVGDKVSGVIVRIGEEHCFVDFGGRSEGIISTVELKDDKGEVNFDPGEPLEAFVVAAGDEIRLSRTIQGEDRDSDVLYQAYKSGVPIQGTITAANKWGVGVDVNGMRAFCPISQLDTKFVQEAEEYRGKTMEFRILRFRDRGRNIVLSRRALLEEERDKEANGVRDKIAKGARLEGKVTRLEDFGAFVDLGAGVEGLVHVSELKHERVEHPKEVLEKGASVKVVVLAVKNMGNRRKERISLSLKALEKDPWDEIRAQFKTGTVAEGKVESIEDYGAFVELAPTVRGMVHVSEMADRRIPHPREVVSVGDRVKVAVMEVDTKRKRLRLSMRRAEQVEDQTNLKEFHERQRQQREDEPTGGSMQDALKRALLVD